MTTTNNVINVDLPFAVAEGGTSNEALLANSILVGDGTSGVQLVGALTNGQVLIGHTGNVPIASTLTAGSGISVTNGAGSITIASTSAGHTWTLISGSTQAIAAANGYIVTTSGLCTLTLPSTAALGDEYFIVSDTNYADSWKIAQNTGQSIMFGNDTTTTGTGGSLASSRVGDAVHIVCTTANTGFTVIESFGNITVV